MTALTVDELERRMRRACVLEATARKPGNVHPFASFDDLTHEDFMRSTSIAAPVLARSTESTIGVTIETAVRATWDGVGRNTNLGICLLIAPLVVFYSRPIHCFAIEKSRADARCETMNRLLDGLTVEDARAVYRAIAVCQPGGMGHVESQDVTGEPIATLRDVMALAAGRDRIAAQYANGYRDVYELALPLLEKWHARADDWETTIIGLHLELMAALPDTLIARKCGAATSLESAARAQRVLDAGWPTSPAAQREIHQLDAWLRADGHRRNPGTTADFVVATLFAAFGEGMLDVDRIARE